jgi:glycosyltransferase involved in cell wall biosynthesis
MLSIITINKNNMLGMQRTINSLKQLQRHEFQWVCIDSNSNDGSVELAQQFKITSDVVISEADTGIYNAMNKGVLQAIGTHLLFLNSGDTLASSITSVDALKLKNQVDLILFGFQIRNQLRLPRPNAWRFWSMPTSHQAIIYSKEVLISEPFDETYRFAADFEHYLRINRTPLRIDRNNCILIVNEPYGSDAHLPRLLAEYRHALIKNGSPWVWAQGVYWLKKFYLKFALR